MHVCKYYFNSKYYKLCQFIYSFSQKYLLNVDYMAGIVLNLVKDLGLSHKSNF